MQKTKIDRDRFRCIHAGMETDLDIDFLFVYIQITTCTYENEMDIHVWIHMCVK